jgi:hypothetical protein
MTGLIIGVVVGGACLLCVGGTLLWRRYKYPGEDDSKVDDTEFLPIGASPDRPITGSLRRRACKFFWSPCPCSFAREPSPSNSTHACEYFPVQSNSRMPASAQDLRDLPTWLDSPPVVNGNVIGSLSHDSDDDGNENEVGQDEDGFKEKILVDASPGDMSRRNVPPPVLIKPTLCSERCAYCRRRK